MSPLKISTGRGGECRRGVADGRAGAQRFVFHGVVNADVQFAAVSELVGEDLGAVGRRQHEVSDAGVARPDDLVHDERNPGDWQHRLGKVVGQGPQPRAQPPDEQDRLDVLAG